MDRLMLTVIGAAAAAALIGALVWHWRRRNGISRTTGHPIERDFRNVFAMTSKERQEAMITGLMDRKKCTRLEAMRLAVEDRRHYR
jgi:hypothetical protein